MLDRLKRSPAESIDWHDSPLFRGLTPNEWAILEQRIQEHDLKPGQVLVHEGDQATHLYIVQTGRLDVFKREKLSKREHRIKQLSAGDVVGEIALLDNQPRVASVRADTACRLIGFAFTRLPVQSAPNEADINQLYLKLAANLAMMVAGKLRKGSEEALQSAHERSAMGELIVNLLILLCAYVILISSLQSLGLQPANTMFVSIPLLLVFGLGSWRFMRKSGFAMRDFGLTHRDLLGSLFESAIFTGVFLLVATTIKWAILQTDDAYTGLAVIEFPDVIARYSQTRIQLLTGVYAASSAVQELIVRGALQSMLERFLTGRHGRFKAILVCALLFSVSHLHTGLLFSLLVFLPGLCWGWLFSRRRNLLGVTLSHVVIGSYVFFILGIHLPQ